MAARDGEGGGGFRGNVLPLVQKSSDGAVDPKNLPQGALWAEWWQGPGVKHLRNPNTAKNYKRTEVLATPLGDFFTAKALEQWAARLCDPRGGCGLSPSTVYNIHWYILGGLYRWAKDHDLVSLNPFSDAERVVPPPAESHPIKNIVEVWPQLLKVARTPTEAALLGVYRFTGCRPEEAPALHPEDVNTSGALWELSITKQRVNANHPHTRAPKGQHGRGNRTMPVRPELRALLAPVLDAWRPVQMTWGKRLVDRQTTGVRFLFPVKRDDLEDLRDRLGQVAPEHFGLGHGLHTFRHTAAYEWFKARVQVATISEYLGHENMMTTEKYLSRMAGGRVRSDPAMDVFFKAPPEDPSCPF